MPKGVMYRIFQRRYNDMMISQIVSDSPMVQYAQNTNSDFHEVYGVVFVVLRRFNGSFKDNTLANFTPEL